MTNVDQPDQPDCETSERRPSSIRGFLAPSPGYVVGRSIWIRSGLYTLKGLLLTIGVLFLWVGLYLSAPRLPPTKPQSPGSSEGQPRSKPRLGGATEASWGGLQKSTQPYPRPFAATLYREGGSALVKMPRQATRMVTCQPIERVPRRCSREGTRGRTARPPSDLPPGIPLAKPNGKSEGREPRAAVH